MKGYLRIPYLLLTAIGMAMLGWALIWLNQKQENAGAWHQAAVVARLIDEEALAFLHAPNFDAAQQALESSHFSELELERPAAFILRRLLPEILTLPSKEQLETLAIQNMALTLVRGEQGWEVLIALQTETSEAKVRSWIQTAWGTPGAETFSELREGMRYHYITSESNTFISSEVEDWQFIATERSLIERALTRLQAETPIRSLSTDATFEKALKPLRSSYALLAYVRPTHAQSDPGNNDSTPISQKLDQLPVTALAAAYSNDRGLLREEVSLLPKDPKPVSHPENADSRHDSLLTLTSPETLIYASANLGGQAIQSHLFREFRRRWLNDDVPTLHPISESWEENFTDAYAVMLEPLREPASGISTANGPMAVVLTFPLANPSVMQAHLSALSETDGSGFQRSAGKTYSLDSAYLPVALVNSLQETHLCVHAGRLLVSDQALGITQVIQDMSLAEGSSLSDRDDFNLLINRLPEPEVAMLFIDTESVLRRGAEAIQHPLVKATLWLGMRGSSSTNILELFPSRTFSAGSELVQPTLAVWEYGETDGLHQDSLGTLTPGQWLLGAHSILSVLDDTLLEDRTPVTASP